MSDEAITLRPGRPTTEDAAAFARFEDIAAEAFFSRLFGDEAAHVLAEVYGKPGHDMSHERTTFAMQGDDHVGLLVTFTAAQHREADERHLRAAAGRKMLALDAARIVGRRMFRFLDTVPDDAYYVLSLAVAPEARGRGVGSMLMTHAEELGRQAGCSRLALDVAVTNTTARRLYEHLGMTGEAMSPRMLFISRLRSCRMTKPL